jgi:hypothetical protein
MDQKASRSGTEWLFTRDDIDRIIDAGSFSVPVQPVFRLPTLPPYVDSDRADFAAALEIFGTTYIQAVETANNRRVDRELSKLLSGILRLRRTIAGKELEALLEPAHNRAKPSFVPKAPHDAVFLDLIGKLERADDALVELDLGARSVMACLNGRRAGTQLVFYLATLWKIWKGRWPGVSVDPKSGRVHGPFIRFVHEVVKSLRAESPNLPMPAAASIRATIRVLRPDESLMSNSVKKGARPAI